MRGLERPYLFSWRYLLSEVCARVAIAAVGVGFSVSKYVFVRRVMSTDWPKYAYPFESHQMFPELMTGVYLLLWYIFTAALLGVLLRFRGKWTLLLLVEELTLSLLGLSQAALMTWTASELVKRMYGRPRPDFLSRCFGSNDIDTWMKQEGFAGFQDVPEIPDCPFYNVSKYDQLDGRQSFPSLHAGLTSAFMVFLGLWIYSKFSYFRNMGGWRIVVPSLYMGFAVAVAVSRTSDYRHHPSDVVAGLILGSSMAILAAVFYIPMKMVPIGERVYKIRMSNNGQSARMRPKIGYRSAAKFEDASSDSENRRPEPEGTNRRFEHEGMMV